MKKFLFFLVCLLFSVVVISASPDRVRMISIGLDYANSPAADEMMLYGTVGDAYQMAAAVKNVMEAKGVEFENIMMVQEGSGDYYTEITVWSPSDVMSLVSDVEDLLIRLNPDSTDGTEYELDDNTYLIRDRFSDIGALSDMFDALSELDTGDGDIAYNFFDIKDTPTYPSADNILNQILLCSDLDADDLLIVYYSGHGGSENGFTMLDAENILLPFVEDGSITESQKDAVLDLDVITYSTVVDRLASLDLDTDTIYEIGEAFDGSEEYYKTGVLATAYTFDNYYSDCSSLEMYMVFAALSYLKCDSVLILDACYSGFAADNLSDYIDEADYGHAVNVAVMSASSMDEESEEYAVENEDGDYESHGAFTLQVLSHLGWELSSTKTTALEVPFYTLASDGSVTDIRIEKEVNGYTAFIPERQTASEFFSSVMEDWDDSDGQHPQSGESNYILYFIP